MTDSFARMFQAVSALYDALAMEGFDPNETEIVIGPDDGHRMEVWIRTQLPYPMSHLITTDGPRRSLRLNGIKITWTVRSPA